MKTVIYQLGIWLCLCSLAVSAYAQGENGMGQTIQINTRFHSYTGRPSWTLIIRDIDHEQNIPYVFDITKGTNFWVALTYSRNYLISVSTMQFSPYRRYPGNTKRIRNFCHLESNGKIIKGESMYITIEGDLSPNTERFDCHISRFPDNHFTVATPDSDS
jgi:hypothetical protein